MAPFFSRLSAAAALSAVVAADQAAPRELFNFGDITTENSGGGFMSSLQQGMQQTMTQAQQQHPFGQQPQQQQSSNPFAAAPSATSAGASPFGDFSAPGFSNDMSSFGQPKSQYQTAHNAGFGGPAITPQTGTNIMTGIIKSFLANQKLAQGEQQCLQSGAGAMGGEVTDVSQKIVGLTEQLLAAKNQGKPAEASKPLNLNPFAKGSPLSSMFGGQKQANSNSPFGNMMGAPVGGPAPPPPAAPLPQPVMVAPAPAAASSGFDFFSSQGRRMQGFGPEMAAMGGNTGSGMNPMMLLSGGATMMQLVKEVQNVAGLGHKIMSTCLKGDGKMAMQQAAKNAKSLQYLSKHLMTNGAEITGEMSSALKSWKQGNAAGFGTDLGLVLRKVFLSSDTSGKLPEGLPPKASLANATAGFMKGFFGPGSDLKISTSETGGAPIDIDMHKCVGNNLGLMQQMWSSTMYFYGHQATMGTTAGSTSGAGTNTPKGSQEMASMLAYTTLQLPRAMKQCNINHDQVKMLKDAIQGMGKGVKFGYQMPAGQAVSKTEVASRLASSVGDYSNMVKDPTKAIDFGKNLGSIFQEAVMTAMNKKYFVDKRGNLKKRLMMLEESQGSMMGSAAGGSMVTPVLLVLTGALLLIAVVALKSRRSWAGWQTAWCQQQEILGRDDDLEEAGIETKRIFEDQAVE